MADGLDTGFGSPTTLLQTPPGFTPAAFDWGWGSPSQLSGFSAWDLSLYQDAGYGSSIQIIVATPQATTIRDDGGQVVELVSAWPIRGPYRVSLVDQDGTEYPCYGLTFGPGADGDLAFADVTFTRLRFATAAVPVGTYSCRVTWLDGTQQEVTLSDVFDVVYRTRHPVVYDMRRALPPRAFRAGTRAMSSERALGA